MKMLILVNTLEFQVLADITSGRNREKSHNIEGYVSGSVFWALLSL